MFHANAQNGAYEEDCNRNGLNRQMKCMREEWATEKMGNSQPLSHSNTNQLSRNAWFLTNEKFRMQNGMCLLLGRLPTARHTFQFDFLFNKIAVLTANDSLDNMLIFSFHKKVNSFKNLTRLLVATAVHDCSPRNACFYHPASNFAPSKFHCSIRTWAYTIFSQVHGVVALLLSWSMNAITILDVIPSIENHCSNAN